LAAIHFTITTLWHDLEMLYVFEYVNQERFTQIYKFIFSLPEVTQDNKVFEDMVKKWKDLEHRIKNLNLGQEKP
jgi:hypothetical protein